MDAKIYTKKELDEKFTNINMKPCTIKMIPAWSRNFIGPFSGVYDAKRYILEMRLKHIKDCIMTVERFINDPEISEMIKQKMGFYKTQKAFRKWIRKHPEYQI
jgi:uncharacterized short protein YbdD (DUF466 family)